MELVEEYQIVDDLNAEYAQPLNENEADLKASKHSSVEIINKPVAKYFDEFLESVKPLDTIELNFQEQISTDIEYVTSNEANINVIMSYNTALEENINFNINDENCTNLERQLSDDVIIQNSFQAHINEIRMQDSITPNDLIEKIALGKYFPWDQL